jgi:hypothetical protein
MYLDKGCHRSAVIDMYPPLTQKIDIHTIFTSQQVKIRKNHPNVSTAISLTLVSVAIYMCSHTCHYTAILCNEADTYMGTGQCRIGGK